MVQIQIGLNGVNLIAEMHPAANADLLIDALPLRITASPWGKELYGLLPSIPFTAPTFEMAEVVEIGALALWGDHLCLFWGRTPASNGNEPRAISPVEVIGRIIDIQEHFGALDGVNTIADITLEAL